MNTSGIRFGWDPRKANGNARKHGVTFEEARTAFLDDHGLLIGDPDHSEDEDRYVLLGLSARLRLLVVCHAYREAAFEIRIVSARKAGPGERRRYDRRNRR